MAFAPAALLLVALLPAQQRPVDVATVLDGLPLGPHVEILEDAQGAWTLEDVQQPELARRFVPSSTREPTFGYSNSTFWMRLRLMGGAHEQTLLLEFSYPVLDDVTVYLQHADGLRSQANAGMTTPFATRQVQHPHLVFRVPSQPHAPVDVWVRVRSWHAAQLGLTLWNPDAFWAREQKGLFGLGILYGTLLAAFLYTLLAWWTVRDRSYLLFVGFVAVMVLLQGSQDGLAFQYVWPNAPGFARKSIPFFTALSAVAAVTFTRAFLGTAKVLPRWDRVLAWLGVLGVLCALAVLWLSYISGVALAASVAMASLAVAGVTAMEARRLGVVHTGSLLLSHVVLGLAFVTASSRPVFGAPSNALTRYGFHVVTSTVALIFVYALGRRINLAEQAALRAQQALARDLEGQVQARTAELEQKNRALADLNARKDELVATVSHDFRSPLATIRQNVQTMLRDLAVMDVLDLRELLEAVARQEARLTAMSSNLLDLARMRNKGVTRAPVHAESMARALVDGMRPLAVERGVALALQVEPGAPQEVALERGRVEQALQNLVDNALKFTPRGGSVTVVVASGGDRGGLALGVVDTGPGVPGEHLPRLFEPFFQVPSTSHAGQGSGLGLAIVRAVADAHGGSVQVTSVVGQGTRFDVWFPDVAQAG